MSDRDGWIKLHRKILDNPVCCKDADHLAVWIYLLLEAWHKEHRTLLGGKPITLQPGQLITGRKKIAKKLGINEHKVDRVIKMLKSEHQIEQQATPYGSVITIVQWGEYQKREQPNEQPVSNRRATSEQPVSTIQEYKEGKEGKENTEPALVTEFDSIWEHYPKKQGKQKALDAYVKARQTGTTFEEVRQGVMAYREHIKRKRVPDRFVKQGGTFFSQSAWQDDWMGGSSGQDPGKGEDLLDGII